MTTVGSLIVGPNDWSRAGGRILISAQQERDRGADMIDLRGAEIGLPGPRAAFDAMNTLRSGPLTLAPPEGLEESRRSLSRHLSTYLLPATPRQIVLSAGATGALSALVLTWTRPGDAVLVPELGFPAHVQTLETLGRRPVRYPLPVSRDDWLHRLAELAPTARLMLWTAPHNPTGAVPSEAATRAVAGIVNRHGLFLISDEACHDLVWRGTHTSPLAFTRPERSAVVWSASKSVRLAALRIGCAVCPADSAERVARAAWSLTLGVSSPAQVAVVAALDEYEKVVAESRRHLRENIDTAVGALAETFGAESPESGTCLWLDVGETGLTGREFARFCRDHCGLLVWPGDRFGSGGERRIRINVGGQRALLHEALTRLARAHRRLASSDT